MAGEDEWMGDDGRIVPRPSVMPPGDPTSFGGYGSDEERSPPASDRAPAARPRPRMRRPGAPTPGQMTADQLNQRELDRLSRDGGAAYGAGFGLEKKKAAMGMKKGGPVKMKTGGKVRGDGVVARGKTKGRYI